MLEDKRREFMDDEKHDAEMRRMFRDEERTEIPSVLPAKDRIKLYRTKVIKRSIPSALPAGRNPLKGAQSHHDLKVAPGSTKDAGTRPITAGIMSQFGQSEAPTAASHNVMVGNWTASNARAISVSRFSKFDENEKSVQAYPFTNFYTSNEPTMFHKENRFEGRSTN